MNHTPARIEKDSSKAWAVCLAASLFFFYDFLILGLFNPLGNQIVGELLHMSGPAAQGAKNSLAAAFMWANVAFLFPGGLVIDRFPIRRVVLTMLVFSLLGVVLLAFSTGYWSAYGARALSGIAHAFCFISISNLVGRWFSPHKQARVMGMCVSIGLFGLTASGYASAICTRLGGVQNTLLFIGALGLLFWGMAFMTIEDYPAEDIYLAGRREQRSLPFAEELSQAASNPAPWLFGLATGMLNLPIMIGLAASLNSFLAERFGFTEAQINLPATCLTIGNLLGSTFGGYSSDWMKSRRKPMLAGSLVSLALCLLLVYMPGLGQGTVSVLLFLIGLVIGVQVISYPAIGESTPPRAAGASMGIAASLVLGSGALYNSFAAGLLSRQAATYQTLYLALPIGAIIAFACVLFAKETYNQPVKDKR